MTLEAVYGFTIATPEEIEASRLWGPSVSLQREIRNPFNGEHMRVEAWEIASTWRAGEGQRTPILIRALDVSVFSELASADQPKLSSAHVLHQGILDDLSAIVGVNVDRGRRPEWISANEDDRYLRQVPPRAVERLARMDEASLGALATEWAESVYFHSYYDGSFPAGASAILQRLRALSREAGPGDLFAVTGGYTHPG